MENLINEYLEVLERIVELKSQIFEEGDGSSTLYAYQLKVKLDLERENFKTILSKLLSNSINIDSPTQD